MRQLFLDKQSIIIKEVSQSHLDDHSVLIAVHYSFLGLGTQMTRLSTDTSNAFSNVPRKVKKALESFKAAYRDPDYQTIDNKSLVYASSSGHVVAVGKKVTRFRPGDLVACASIDHANYADLVCAPETLVAKVRNEKFLKAASLTAGGSVVLQALRRAKLRLGDRICVVGLGLLGQLTMRLAKISGCTVIGIDSVPERVKMAKDAGFEQAFHFLDENLQHEIDMITEHEGVDATIITAASDSNAVVRHATEITRRCGRLVLVCDVDLNLEQDSFYKKEVDLIVACPSYSDGYYRPSQRHEEYVADRLGYRNMQSFVDLIESSSLDLNSLVLHEVGVSQLHTVEELLADNHVPGVVVCYQAQQHRASLVCQSFQKIDVQEPRPFKPVMFVPAQRDTLRVGIVGVGNFARQTLIPELLAMRNVTIDALADIDSVQSERIARRYNIPRTYTWNEELLQEDGIDVVIIASPHKFHCEQALKALRRGKAVFVEKPAVTSFMQLKELRSFLRDHPHAPLCVDFNRSFAPFVHNIHAVVSKRRAPLMAHYRINSNFLPKDHWIQTSVGAGRIIGKACQIVDLFYYLIEARPVAVSVDAVHASRDDVFPTDNFSAQISFDDGSVCSLMHTAFGSAKSSSERLELFFDGKSIVMDDYVALFGYGLSSTFNQTTVEPDRGHTTLLEQFFAAIRKAPYEPPISLSRLLTVSELTLIIDQLACEGGGTKILNRF